MDEPRRPSLGREEVDPAPDTTAAAAFAPPPGSAASIRLFIATLVLVICLVAGLLTFFTDLPVGYAIALLAVAVLAGVVVTVHARRRAARRS